MQRSTVNPIYWGRKLIAWSVLIILPFTVLSMVAIPFFKFSVNRLQTAQDLELAYTLTKWAPRVGWLTLVIAAGTALWLWRVSRRWWSRLLVPIAMLPVLGSIWISHQSPVDRWLFKQPENGGNYARIHEVDYVTDDDMVMTVEINGDAVAYPIRFMAFHHIVHDVVGGTPIVATY